MAWCKTFVVAAAFEQTSGEFIYNHNFAVVGDYIVFVSLEQCLGFQCLLQVVNGTDIFGAIEAVNSKDFFNVFDTIIG